MAYQKDISAILGLSVSTVSRALKGYPDISEETRRKVIQTAEKLDYRIGKKDGEEAPVHRAGAVGVMAEDFEKLLGSLYYREMLCGMAAEASREKKDLVIMGTEPDGSGISSVGRAANRNVDGICLMASKEDLLEGRFAELLMSRIPVVSLENHITGHTAVCRDARDDAHQLLEYLKDRGHLKTAYIGDLSLDSRKKAAMLDEEAKKLEMSCRRVTRTRLIEKIAKKGVSGIGNDSCLLFDNGKTAEQMLEIMESSGIRVPEDVSVVALDTDYDEREDNRVTCLITSPQCVGEAAIHELIHIAEHPEMDMGECVSVKGRVHGGDTVMDLSVPYTRNV